ncbi:Bug family tripartite tricarboxylate transporter substrate binding protein [Pollutimonas harenae]|uniref:Tripartite tricarboxylate transporter substrate binding protein n=1 Tax=Pollutimonas harenae TaxID=657015 RepID=A0A853GRA2_9BURK|nr:tripartite tricarboxylate transporter substrate binding protein [Pollutimonas harenae]NYT85608.1 tripartite tricarboxylate transporter substrate binding protein [Pollutimonas harenae]TEA70688.1 tripartite tricarboxylate transporter substrate binding protein [Pollutimonas harenae]
MLKTCTRIIAAGLLSSLVTLASAANYPERAVTVVTPFPAGGATDALARVLTEHMSKTLGQSMVVENRAGAATTIGASYAARAKPDGYTILLATNSTLVTNRYLFKTLSYDPDAFTPIGMIGIGPMVLLSAKKHDFKSVADVINFAKKQPGALSVASFGAGTSSHLAAEYFQQVADIDMLHVPFKGSTQALPQLINGDVDVFFDMVSTGMPQVDAGKVDVLAITSKNRLSSLPKLPTISEAGYPGFEITAWFTLVAPPNTPSDVTSTLRQALQAALKDPKIHDQMLNMGLEPGDGSAEALTTQIKTEKPIIEALVKRAGIVVQ